LDKVLHKIDVDRSDLYITNLVKLDLLKTEIRPKTRLRHGPFLRKEIEDINPEMIITLGNFASREMLNKKKKESARSMVRYFFT